MKLTFDGGGDHGYRSDLERRVAEEMTALGVTWRYEVPVRLPGVLDLRYLPDFVIDEAKPDLLLPAWVECKPMQMLYTLRDVLGVTRRVGEYFKDDVSVEGLTSTDLHDRDLGELAKPKRLAELSGLDVLLVGAVQGTNSLSALLTPTGCVLSRQHPLVNQRGLQRQAERDEKHARWERESRERMAAYETERAAKARSESAGRAEVVASWVANLAGATPRFASSCYGCGSTGIDGYIYRVAYMNGTEGWQRVCRPCRARTT